jgi:hypothetical protein
MQGKEQNQVGQGVVYGKGGKTNTINRKEVSNKSSIVGLLGRREI